MTVQDTLHSVDQWVGGRVAGWQGGRVAGWQGGRVAMGPLRSKTPQTTKVSPFSPLNDSLHVQTAEQRPQECTNPA